MSQEPKKTKPRTPLTSYVGYVAGLTAAIGAVISLNRTGDPIRGIVIGGVAGIALVYLLEQILKPKA